MDDQAQRRRHVSYSVPSSPARMAPAVSCSTGGASIPRIRSEPTLQLRASRLQELYSYAPKVRASFIAAPPKPSGDDSHLPARAPPRRRLSVVIERKRLRTGAPVRTEISFDSGMALRCLILLLFLSGSTALVAMPAAQTLGRYERTHGGRAATSAGDNTWLQDADPYRDTMSRLVPPAGARADFVHACLAASERASTADGGLRPPRWLLSRLTEGACAVAFPHTFGAMRRWHSERAASAGSELSAAAAQLEEGLAEILPRGSFQIQQRVKSLPSLFEKVWLRGKRADDLLALRVVLDDSPRDDWQISPSNRQHGRCLDVRGVAASLWDELAFRDYIAAPKPNGYCSLHVALALPSGASLELQVRTRRMHEDAETGSAAHALYKQEAMHEAAVSGRWAPVAPGDALVA